MSIVSLFIASENNVQFLHFNIKNITKHSYLYIINIHLFFLIKIFARQLNYSPSSIGINVFYTTDKNLYSGAIVVF